MLWYYTIPGLGGIMPKTDETVLQEELEYFETQKEALLKTHAGQFALVAGKELIGTYTTESDAYEAGLKQFGNRPFLIRRISSQEPPLQAPVLFVGVDFGSNA